MTLACVGLCSSYVVVEGQPVDVQGEFQPFMHKTRSHIEKQAIGYWICMINIKCIFTSGRSS